MADDFDIDWGDDPFGGDLDFDMDFDMDPFKGKGFLRSVATGFLQGIGTETVGSSAARFKTARTLLPSSFTNALDKATFINDRLGQLAVEFREENAEAAKSLQNIATHINQKMGDKLPGFMNQGLSNFSSKDFSSWEKLESRSDRFSDRVDSTSESDVEQAIGTSINSQSGMFASLGDSLNSMTAAATGALQASIGAGNRQLINIEGTARDTLSYLRNVDAKIQQAQLNLAARSYVNQAKFYKFMEAGVHAEVAELKKITRYTGMSDFEKTSTFTASKAYMRQKVFNTVGKRIGGLSGLLRDRFSENGRKEAYGVVGSLLNNVSDGLSMAGDTDLSRGMIGNLIGNMMAGVAVDQLPAFFKRGPGKKAIDRLTKLYPDQAGYIKEQITKLTDVGNVLSYASTSGVGMLNYMSQNYQPMDEMKYTDYEHYLDDLPPGKKPLPKSAWTVLNAAGNRGKEAINKLMRDTTKTRGTQYSLKKRNVKDLNQPGIWKEINNITLNEVLPGLISKTNVLLEQMRTGKDNVESVNYNYMRGEFQTDSQRRISVQADLMSHGEFQRYAQAALSLVDSIDPDKMLSSSSRKAFAQQVAKDIDGEMGFNPYYYLGNIKGVSSSAQKEIHAALMRHFGITTQDVGVFNSSDSFQRMKQMTNMPTKEGRERLNHVSANAENIKTNFPNVSERIDLLRSTGNEQMLRDLGIIYTDNGIDKINIQAFHDRIGQYMDDPNNPLLRGVIPGQGKKAPTVGPGLRSIGNTGPTLSPVGDLNETLRALTEKLSAIPQSQGQHPNQQNASLVNFDSVTGVLTEIKDNNVNILTSTKSIEALMGSMVELAKAGKLMTGAPKSATVERQEESAKKSFLAKVKGYMPTGVLGKGMDFFMSRNPIVLGGILGSIGAAVTSKNWMLSGAMAATGLGIGLAIDHYQRRKNKSTSAEGATSAPNDDEDILDENNEPLLKSAKLKAGEYLDAVTRRVIKTWSDIRGPVIDIITKAVIGVRDLAGKIFGPDGRALALTGLRRVKDGIMGAYNLANPLGRLRSLIDTGKELVYQQDIYVKGQKEPALRVTGFKSGDYYIRDESGNFKPISGWNEINGPVYDGKGNQLISESEYKTGLVTSSGMAVRNLGSGVANIVGGAAGLARSGVNAVLGKFGYTAPGVKPGTNSASQTNRGSSGVEHRLDLIYKMLSQHFGIPMETTGMNESIRSAITGGSAGPKMRLNSLAWKKKEADEEEKHKVNKAIIQIAKNTKGLGDDHEDGKKSTGFFGKIKDMFIALGGFGLKLIKNPIGTIGSMIFGSMINSTARLAKIGTALFSGVLGIASPIFKLMKWGFTKIAGGLFGRGRRSGPNTNSESPDQRGQSSRDKKKKGSSRRRGGRIGGFLKGAVLSAVGSYALDSILGNNEEDYENGTEDLESGQRDPVTGRYATTSDKIIDTAIDWLPQGGLAKSIVEGVLGPKGYEDLDNKGLFWTSDGSFFFDRRKRDAAQAALEGKPVIHNAPGVDKAATKLTTQRKIRLGMYGIKNTESSLARRVMALENQMYQYVVIRDGNASLKPDTPTAQIVNAFADSGMDEAVDKGSVGIWFMSRFKPIFMTFNAGVATEKMGDIVGFDNSKSYDVIKVIEKVQRTVASMSSPPYSIDVRIDAKEATMGPEQTRDVISKLFEQLKKDLPAPPEDTVETRTQQAETQVKETVNTPPAGGTPQVATASSPGMGSAAASASQKAADGTTVSPADVMTVDISDMYPGKDGKLDPFTLARLAVYGNNTSTPWRLEAVLKLERYTEKFIMISGNDARFTGKSGQLMELFKAAFHINERNTQSKNNWSLWFRDRFLPTLMEYAKQVYKLRGGLPAKNWQSLSDTNRIQVARGLVNLIVSVDDKHVPVWTIKASPFPDSDSNSYPDRADRYLDALDAKAKEAKAKDPEMEQVKSQPTNVGKEEVLQRAQANQSNKANVQSILDSVYKTGSTGFASGGGLIRSTPGAANSVMVQGGYYPNATMSAPGGGAGSAGAFMGKADANFNPEFIKKAGADKGIKMSLEQGDQLMLNHLVKAGFRDIKTLALALAMARKETGGYQSTVENTNWSAPTLLKYFKNIPDAATAQKVAAMSPVERAMWVYGRAPKGPQLGNQKPEDGWMYRGRGLFQLTGKANYEAFKKASGIDVVSHPELVSEDPNVMAESAVWFLKNNAAMKSIAKTGDFNTAVRGINGGNAVPATDERRTYYNDYLNKLKSGELTIPGGTDSVDGAGKNDQAAMNNQTPDIPTAADQNVPANKVIRSGETGALLDRAEKSSAPSNSGNPPATSNASPLSQSTVTSSAPASSNNDSPVINSNPTSIPGSSPTTSNPVSPQSSTSVSANSTQTVPDRTKSTTGGAIPTAPVVSEVDKAMADIGVQQLTVLKEISKKLDSKPSGVKM